MARLDLNDENIAKRMESNKVIAAFGDGKQYALTGLGQQFVHYTMNGIVPRIEANAESEQAQQ